MPGRPGIYENNSLDSPNTFLFTSQTSPDLTHPPSEPSPNTTVHQFFKLVPEHPPFISLIHSHSAQSGSMGRAAKDPRAMRVQNRSHPEQGKRHPRYRHQTIRSPHDHDENGSSERTAVELYGKQELVRMKFGPTRTVERKLLQRSSHFPLRESRTL